ncbi:hypothetical protein BJ912DRAFT_1150120 [Pholiota molesta]|nr:hypothetical protein BJ912DRAFT_1150120 [Pholiota molesta]
MDEGSGGQGEDAASSSPSQLTHATRRRTRVRQTSALNALCSSRFMARASTGLLRIARTGRVRNSSLSTLPTTRLEHAMELLAIRLVLLLTLIIRVLVTPVVSFERALASLLVFRIHHGPRILPKSSAPRILSAAARPHCSPSVHLVVETAGRCRLVVGASPRPHCSPSVPLVICADRWSWCGSPSTSLVIGAPGHWFSRLPIACRLLLAIPASASLLSLLGVSSWPSVLVVHHCRSPSAACRLLSPDHLLSTRLAIGAADRPPGSPPSSAGRQLDDSPSRREQEGRITAVLEDLKHIVGESSTRAAISTTPVRVREPPRRRRAPVRQARAPACPSRTWRRRTNADSTLPAAGWLNNKPTGATSSSPASLLPRRPCPLSPSSKVALEVTEKYQNDPAAIDRQHRKGGGESGGNGLRHRVEVVCGKFPDMYSRLPGTTGPPFVVDGVSTASSPASPFVLAAIRRRRALARLDQPASVLVKAKALRAFTCMPYKATARRLLYCLPRRHSAPSRLSISLS